MLWTILAFIVGCVVGLIVPSPFQKKAKDAVEHLRGEFEDEVIDRIKERL